jgi:hypothetical protein
LGCIGDIGRRVSTSHRRATAGAGSIAEVRERLTEQRPAYASGYRLEHRPLEQ